MRNRRDPSTLPFSFSSKSTGSSSHGQRTRIVLLATSLLVVVSFIFVVVGLFHQRTTTITATSTSTKTTTTTMENVPPPPRSSRKTDVHQEVDAIIVPGAGSQRSEDVRSLPKWVVTRLDAAILAYHHHSRRVNETLVSSSSNEQQNNVQGSHPSSSTSSSSLTTTATSRDSAPRVIVLSAGTVHRPNFINQAGWPILEATSEAMYLLQLSQERGMPIPPAHILRECTSLDTIGNAYFTRVTHTELAGYRRLHVITSAFHMARTKAIFDFVFALPFRTPRSPLPHSTNNNNEDEYEVTYEETSDGMDLTPEEEEAMVGRRLRERASLIGFFATLQRVFGMPNLLQEAHQKLAGAKDGAPSSGEWSDEVIAAALEEVGPRTRDVASCQATLADVHRFLFEDHSAYKTHLDMIVVKGNVDSKTLNSY
jgi:uncharacterized SAM-binding protein YcdF (DUF218 family)